MRVVKVTVEIQSVESLKTKQKEMEPSQQQIPYVCIFTDKLRVPKLEIL